MYYLGIGLIVLIISILLFSYAKSHKNLIVYILSAIVFVLSGILLYPSFLELINYLEFNYPEIYSKFAVIFDRL